MFNRQGFYFYGSLQKDTNKIISAYIKNYFNDNVNFLYLFAGQMSLVTSLDKNGLLNDKNFICSEIEPFLCYCYCRDVSCKIELLEEYLKFNEFVGDDKYFNICLLLDLSKVFYSKSNNKEAELEKKYHKYKNDERYVNYIRQNAEKYKRKLSFANKINFMPSDSYKLFEEYKDKNYVIVCFPPFFVDGYAKQFKFFNEKVIFDKKCYVDYEVNDHNYFDNVAFFYKNCKDLIIVADKKQLDKSFLQDKGFLQSARNNTEIVLAKKDNKDIIKYQASFDLGGQKREYRIKLPAGISLMTEQDYKELSTDDVLISYFLDNKSATALCCAFLKKVNIITASQYNTLSCIKKKDGRILAFGLIRLDSKSRKNLFVKTDLVFCNIGSLSKLNVFGVLNDEYNDNIVKKTTLVLDVKKEKTTTAVFTDNFVSMKYRNVAKLVKREELDKNNGVSGCRFKLTYEFRKDIWQKTLQDCYIYWFRKWRKV